MTPLRVTRTRAGRLLAVASIAAAPLALAGASPAPVQAVEPEPAFVLDAPEKLIEYGNGKRIHTDFGAAALAEDAPFEIWTQRLSYDEDLTTTWQSPGGPVVLGTGLTGDLNRLDDFLTVAFKPVTNNATPAFTETFDACIGEQTWRISPDSPFKSDFPRWCGSFYNPYALGSVQGVAQGHASTLLGWDAGRIKIKPGRYDLRISISDTYAGGLGFNEQQSLVLQRLVVKTYDGCRGCRETRPQEPETVDRTPVAEEPTGPGVSSLEDLPPGTPTPDLRSLPAFNIQLNSKGTQLRFSANVWNGGNSPLVVDGFRVDETTMDAYQYFLDEDGDEVAHQQVGQMIWHDDPTHNHWHFTDFAKYGLLDADLNPVAPSQKESFCLANTDAVDFTNEGAQWDVGEDDLGSVCGDQTTQSIREVLAAGWGDTYSQWQAGQSIPISGVPDGVYYLQVLANPDENLIESDTTNNESLRQVKLRTTASGERRVKVFPVGIIVEEFNYR